MASKLSRWDLYDTEITDFTVYNSLINKWYDEDYCKQAIAENVTNIKYCKIQTEEMCLFCVRKNPHTLQWIVNQTYEVCLEALKRNPAVIQFVRLSKDEAHTVLEEACLNRI